MEDQEPQLGIKLENHVREGEISIIKGINISDFGLLLLLLIFIPTAGHQFMGLDWKFLLPPGILFLIYVTFFKVGKPKSYFRHLISHKLRDLLWKSESNTKHNYQLIERVDTNQQDFNWSEVEDKKLINNIK